MSLKVENFGKFIKMLIEAQNSILEKTEVKQSKVSVKQLPWTEEEDELIMQFFEDLPQNLKTRIPWIQASELINQIVYNGQIVRSNHNVRERWVSYLNPNLKKTKWSTEEDLLIVTNKVLKEKHWNYTSKQLKNRNNHQIKNRFYQIFQQFLTNSGNSAFIFKQVLNISNVQDFIAFFGRRKDKKLKILLAKFSEKNQKIEKLKQKIFKKEKSRQDQQVIEKIPSIGDLEKNQLIYQNQQQPRGIEQHPQMLQNKQNRYSNLYQQQIYPQITNQQNLLPSIQQCFSEVYQNSNFTGSLFQQLNPSNKQYNYQQLGKVYQLQAGTQQQPISFSQPSQFQQLNMKENFQYNMEQGKQSSYSIPEPLDQYRLFQNGQNQHNQSYIVNPNCYSL